MTLNERLKQLRTELGLSQEAMGAQGFCSAPGWIKLESGQRKPSDKLIDKLCQFVAQEKRLTIRAAAELGHELKTLKYCAVPSAFVRYMAQKHAGTIGLVDAGKSSQPKPGRGRPKGAKHSHLKAAPAGIA